MNVCCCMTLACWSCIHADRQLLSGIDRGFLWLTAANKILSHFRQSKTLTVNGGQRAPFECRRLARFHGDSCLVWSALAWSGLVWCLSRVPAGVAAGVTARRGGGSLAVMDGHRRRVRLALPRGPGAADRGRALLPRRPPPPPPPPLPPRPACN